MNSEFVNNTFISEENYDWLLQDLTSSFQNNVTSSQTSHASSEYLHDSLDLGLNDDDVNAMMADMNNCGYETSLSSPFSSSNVACDWESTLPPDTPVTYLPPDTPVELPSPGSSTFAYTPGELASPECSIFFPNEFEKKTDVKIEGTIVHIPEQIEFVVNPAGYVENRVEYVEYVEDPIVYATPEHPIEYAVPLSVSSEMTTDDEEDCDVDPLTTSMSVSSDVSCDGSTMSSTSLFTDDYLCSVSVKQLNLKIRDLAVPRQMESMIKKRRRTLKNRGYAHSSRQKRNGRHIEVDEINAKLRREFDDMKRERDALKRENCILRRKVAQHEVQLVRGGVVVQKE